MASKEKLYIVISADIIGQEDVPIGKVISENYTLVILEESSLMEHNKFNVSGYYQDKELGEIRKKNFNRRRVFPLDYITEEILIKYGVDIETEKKELIDKVKLFLSK